MTSGSAPPSALRRHTLLRTDGAVASPQTYMLEFIILTGYSFATKLHTYFLFYIGQESSRSVCLVTSLLARLGHPSNPLTAFPSHSTFNSLPPQHSQSSFGFCQRCVLSVSCQCSLFLNDTEGLLVCQSRPLKNKVIQ